MGLFGVILETESRAFALSYTASLNFYYYFESLTMYRAGLGLGSVKHACSLSGRAPSSSLGWASYPGGPTVSPTWALVTAPSLGNQQWSRC